jgi:hypothetical protein
MIERASRTGYLIFAGLFALGVLAQVFLVGLSLLGGRPSWEEHIGLGHSLAGPLLFMLILAYTGRMPRPIKPLTWATFGVYLVLADIVIFMREVAPLAAALHPVLAMVLFALAAHLPVRAWRIVRRPAAETAQAATEGEIPGAPRSERAA